MRLNTLRAPGVITFLATILLLSATSYSEERKEKRSHPVPESLCGTTVGAESLGSFMPPGERTHQSEEKGDASWFCAVSVDGEEIFRVSRKWWEPGWSARRFASAQAYVQPDHEAADGSYVYSGKGAVGAVRCTSEGKKWDLFIVAKATEKSAAGAEDMEKFITAYREEFLNTDPCAEV
ncbi:hypothetical protein GCM10010420_31060 [Streptomyces glaucosporus]|uniref:Secreted protein n=1 Tax=Streptomyces glaucosporus TaxID=284044 RepID=A0ABP5VJI6_9ACTN